MRTNRNSTKPVDLSMQCGLNLLHVSFSLKNRTAALAEMNMEVGEYQGRFYLLDFTSNKISRITLGAFKHLSQAWKEHHLWAGAKREKLSIYRSALEDAAATFAESHA